MSEETQMQHGIASAYYASNGEIFYPFMRCICGFETGREWRSWEEAGAALDEHLKESQT